MFKLTKFKRVKSISVVALTLLLSVSVILNPIKTKADTLQLYSWGSVSIDNLSGAVNSTFNIAGNADDATAVNVYWDGQYICNVPVTQYSSNGNSFSGVCTVPANTSAGYHTINVQPTGYNQNAYFSFNVTSSNTTTYYYSWGNVSLSQMSGSVGTTLNISGIAAGAGSVNVYMDGQFFCGLSTSDAGNGYNSFNGNCVIPMNEASGKHFIQVQPTGYNENAFFLFAVQ